MSEYSNMKNRLVNKGGVVPSASPINNKPNRDRIPLVNKISRSEAMDIIDKIVWPALSNEVISEILTIYSEVETIIDD